MKKKKKRMLSIAGMCCCGFLAVATAISGSSAYQTDHDEVVNIIRTGNNTIIPDEDFPTPTPVPSSGSVVKKVRAKNTGDVPCYVRAYITCSEPVKEFTGLDTTNWVKQKQEELSALYDGYTAKFGILNSRANRIAFDQDSSYSLICSLENLDEEGNFKEKAAIFQKRTIKQEKVVTSVDTASEALTVSLSEKAVVDLPYMSELSGKDTKEIVEELRGVIFEDPITGKWETADEYLSGNVREKLKIAISYAETKPEFSINVQALKQIQPQNLDASEIEIRIGATWIDPKYIDDFMGEVFQTPHYLLDPGAVKTSFSNITSTWNIAGKNAETSRSFANTTFGTTRVTAYKLLEDTLNLKDIKIYDTFDERRVLNKEETTIASQKQENIKEAFKDWIFRDLERRHTIVETYNELFNSVRPREYEGSHLTFPGMTPDIELKPHQKNAIAHILYGNNTLLEKQLEVYQAKENEIAQEEEKQLEQIPVKRRISWSSFFHDSKIKRKEELDIQEQAERERLAKEYIYDPSHSEEQAALFLDAAGTEEWTLKDLRTLAAQSDIDSMKILQRKIEQLHKASQKKIINSFLTHLQLLFYFEKNDKINIVPLLRR